MMKIEKNFKQICWMPICSFLGIIIGIIVANYFHENIGIGISLGWSIGFFVGAVILFIVSKLQKKGTKKDKILFILYAILGAFMLCDAVLMFYNNEIQAAIKDMLFGIGFGLIGFVYLLSCRNIR